MLLFLTTDKTDLKKIFITIGRVLFFTNEFVTITGCVKVAGEKHVYLIYVKLIVNSLTK